MSYKTLVAKIGVSNDVLRIFDGAIEVPDFTVEAPADPGYGFTPALIPLWSNPDWPGYIGIVKHWFGNEPMSFALYYVEGQEFVEVAKDFEQLKAWMVFDFLRNVPAPDEVGRFAESIGFCGQDDVDDVFAECNNVSELKKLDVFKDNLPAVLTKVKEEGEPDWCVSPSTLVDINKLLAAGDYEQAWYALNCSRLAVGETKAILAEMSKELDDPLFNELIDCWVTANEYVGA